jgi:hypothetical protein
MAKAKAKTKLKKSEAPVPAWLSEKPVVAAVAETKSDVIGGDVDPQEEKILDWILKGVVGFILAWLGLSFLLVVGGLFHLWG